MLVFSTKLYVKHQLTDEKFIEMATTWVSGGQHYTFGKVEWDRSEEFSVENGEGTQKFKIMKYKDAVIVHLENREGKVIWTNDFVLTQKEDKRILAVMLYNDAADMSARLPQEFHCPRLLKNVLSENYGDNDRLLVTNNLPLIINFDNIEIAKTLILGQTEYFMPVVYVTASLYASTLKLDVIELAKDLAGVAHVLVEASSECTRRLRDLTDGKNPYDGAVQIFYSPTITQRLLPRYFENAYSFRKEVTDSVFRKLILSRIDDEFSWTKIRYNNLMKESQRNVEEIDVACQQLLDEMQDKVDAGNKRIQELEERNSQLQGKLQVYQFQFNKAKEHERGILLEVQEVDLYEDEIKDVVLKVLEKEWNTMNSDPNLKESRKYHVLNDICRRNFKTETPKKIIDALRTMLSKNNNISKSQGKLNELGFEIKEGKHHKMIYRGDERYMFTISKTGSDYRENDNIVTEVDKKLFGG